MRAALPVFIVVPVVVFADKHPLCLCLDSERVQNLSCAAILFRARGALALPDVEDGPQARPDDVQSTVILELVRATRVGLEKNFDVRLFRDGFALLPECLSSRVCHATHCITAPPCDPTPVTVLSMLLGEVTVAADDSPILCGSVEVRPDEFFYIELTVSDRAAVAAAQRFQQVGFRIDADRGDGVMVTFPDRELGNVFTISEDGDSFGDTFAFQLIGERFNPFARAQFQRRTKIEAYARIGNTRNEFAGKVFTGYVISASHQIHPPVTDVMCIDAAGLYAERRAKNYSIPPNSQRSRLSIGTELLLLGGIPIGSIDLGGDGGKISKPLTLSDTPILEFLRDFWGILGVDIDFENDAFCARRYSPDLAPVIELNAGNIVLPATLTAPDTLAPNVTGVVSVSFSRAEPRGVRTPVETSVVTVGPHAVLSHAGPADVKTQVISEVISRTSYLGTLDVRYEEEEFGWYAVRAAPSRVIFSGDEPGYEVAPVTETVYTYPDGSTRGDREEKFRRIRKLVRTKDVDADGNVIRTREARYFLHFIRRAIWQVDGSGEDVPVEFPIYVNDDGEGVLGGREVMGLSENDQGMRMEGGLSLNADYLRPDELTITEVRLNADGTIFEEVTTDYFYDPGPARYRATGTYGYGLDSRSYTALSSEMDGDSGEAWGGKRTTTKRFRVLDEDRYEMTETIREGVKAPTTRTSRPTGAPPRPERVEAETSSQEIRGETVDSARVALVGEEIEDVEHNEYIETRAEAQVYSRHRARKKAARVLECSMPFETLAHKFRMLTVNLPNSSIHGEQFYIQSIRRDGATFRQTLTAEWYPPDLR
jgi:hypothetical protein